MYGRYVETQMPFIGINHTCMTNSFVDIFRADLRVNLFKQHYATLYANYMFDWEIFLNEFNRNHSYGFGLGYSVNTIIGPVQLIVHWSNISRKVGVHFSLGFDF